MEELKFEGTWTALVTPFTEEGKVDWEGLERNIEFQVSQGICGLVPTGTTGESPTLGWEEHNRIIEKVIKSAGKRCPVMAGTGSNRKPWQEPSTPSRQVRLPSSSLTVITTVPLPWN